MRILVVSDTHGRERNLERVLAEHGSFSYIIHLGDAESGEQRIREMAGCPVYMVAGNCDYHSKLPAAAVAKIGGHRIFITHGHHYYVNAGLGELRHEARKKDCDIAMFGHTHIPYFSDLDAELTVLNPGSLTSPRQPGYQPSYMIMEIAPDGAVSYEQFYL